MTLYQLSIFYEIITVSFLLYLINNYINKFIEYIKGIYLVISLSINNLFFNIKYLITGELLTCPNGVKYILKGFGIKYFDIHKKRFNKKVKTPFAYKISYRYRNFDLYFSLDKKWFIYINKKLLRIKDDYDEILEIINPKKTLQQITKKIKK